MCVLTFRAVDRVFEAGPGLIKPKTIQLVFVVSLLIKRHLRSKREEWLRLTGVCISVRVERGVCLLIALSMSYHYKNPNRCVV